MKDIDSDSSPSEVIFDFLTRHSTEETARDRILLYRSASRVLSLSEEYTDKLIEIANQLEKVENETLELGLRFRKDRT